MTEAQYWRLRFTLSQIDQQQAALVALRAEVRRQMEAAGLDPEGEYRLDDATCAAVRVAAAPATQNE